MIRTQVQLTKEQYDTLKVLSVSEGISIASLVRRSVDRFIAEQDQRTRQVERAIQVAGRFRSGCADVSTDHDRHLSEIHTP